MLCDSWPYEFVTGGGAIGVEAFLVLSGYGIYQSYESKNLNNYWTSKLEKVWLPYFIWEILALIYYRATSIKSFENISLIEIIASLIGISPYNVIDKTMWYIPFIFIGYFAFWIISKRFKEKKLVVLFTIASLLLAFLAAIGLFPRYTGAWLYVFGMPIGVAYSWSICEEKKWNKEALIALCGLLLWPIAQNNVLLYTGFVTSVGLSIIVLPNIRIRVTGNKLLKWIGKNSYFIYLCEAVVIDTMGYMLPEINRYIRDVLIVGVIALITSGKQILVKILKK